ncbi:hypothetical protein L226DRAFT_493352 [Lentinus tigrinus ALCF2SS1-7]|uniref:F-box domain-containing protein n=1 Tax=Lentinus tigrinus ALCF2SS1-6 TaxID=1328759 RepID=A0A5C2RWM1_9APHY|nr:hypothetical protein L227DRAFT_657066 [Lentinus tigrinus ALCF2SS1-6]RPD70125.1 hypothetical protein L226DRAFT_493352 [Lentinus tigrinus ALCF2SS1-7]
MTTPSTSLPPSRMPGERDSPLLQEQRRAIHRLPNEILLEIFQYTQEMVKQMVRSRYPSPPKSCAPWYDLLRVCKRWSVVARGSPVLWRDIYIWKDLDTALLRYSLTFSGEMPVDVRISRAEGLLDSAMNVLAPNAHRVRSLKLLELNVSPDFSLALFLYHSMPLLEELSLGWDYEVHDRANNLDPLNPNQQEDEEGDPIRYPFFWFPKIQQFPRLAYLSLQRTTGFSLRFPVFPTLRCLELSYCILLGDIALADFLTWLAQHPMLEELSITRVPFSLAAGSSLRLPSTLRKFTLEDFPLCISAFLSKMAPLPTDLNVRVIRRCRYLPPNGTPETPITAVYSLPLDRTILPILSLVTTVIVHMRYWDIYDIVGRTSLGTAICISAWIPEEPPEILDFLGDLRSAFEGAPVSELRVESHDDHRLSEERWRNALLAFPDLRKIAVTDTYIDCDDDYMDACLYLLKALRASVPDAQGHTLCAALVVLELVADHSSRDAELAQEIAACLADRAAHGVQLDELRILLTAMEDGWITRRLRLTKPELLRRRAVYVEALQSSVRVLCVEEWRDVSDPPFENLYK